MITSTSNQQMKNLTLLMKKAKARNEQGVFVAEGRKMFLEAPVEWVKQVYVSESFYETCMQGNMQDCMKSCTPKHGEEKLNRKVLERLNETGYEIVSDNVFKSVSDTHRRESSV
jgi:TrmH family RNA methyltransferase